MVEWEAKKSAPGESGKRRRQEKDEGKMQGMSAWVRVRPNVGESGGLWHLRGAADVCSRANRTAHVGRTACER